jgi:endonuclease-3|tara:strand:- start:2004 stop:2714 length:711 start_codon:yes stop_codon:yes gene_type:complete
MLSDFANLENLITFNSMKIFEIGKIIRKIQECRQNSSPTAVESFIELNKKRNPFKVLISTIISLRTKDEVTYKASKALFKLASTPQRMSLLTLKQIQNAIYPCGFYKNKSKIINNISKRILNEYNGKTPDSIDELLKFKGVGRKTANLVIILGYNKLGICVDTHVHRIFNRIGYVDTKSPDETENELRKKLPKKYWMPINSLFVFYGQKICKPISPYCSKCTINEDCKKKGVTTKR